MEGGAYARALEEARKEFVAGVPEVMAASSGAVFVAMSESGGSPTLSGAAEESVRRGVFRVPYLDGSFEVTYPEGRLTLVWRGVGGEATVAEAVIVLHYLARAAGALDLADPVRFQGLPGASAYVSAFRAHAETPLIERFGEDGRAYVAAARALGGRPASAIAAGASSAEGGTGDDEAEEDIDDPEVMWRLPFLPCLPLGVRLGLAEDGFPAECVVMFPRRAGFVHYAEDLAVAGEVLCDRLLTAADAVAAGGTAAGAAGDTVVSLVTVYDPVEAEIIVAKLRSADIEAMVRHDALSVVYGLTVDGAGRSEVLVRAVDLPEARGALEEASEGEAV